VTLSTLLTNLYRRCNFADTPDAAVTTRLTMFLNQRHRALLTSSALQSLKRGFTSFTSTGAGGGGSAVSEYGMPYGVARVLAVREETNDRLLEERSWEWYRSQQPDPTNQSGTPDCWVPLGIRAIARKPADTGVWVVSTSALDTTQVVTIVGIVGTTPTGQRGATLSLTATLNGTTAVRLGVAQTFDDVVSWSVNAACAGSLSLLDAAAAGFTLGVLPIGRQVARNLVIALAPTPSSTLTYKVDFEHALVDLVNTWDQPLLPEDFHDILIAAVLMDEYQHRDDSRYQAAAQEYRQRVSDLKCWLFNHRPATSPNARRELAPLGAWYPGQYT
jgi:hypothetical protein